MNIEIIDHDIVDSDDSRFKSKVRFNFTDDDGLTHSCELKVFNCSFNKKRIKKEDFILEQIMVVGDISFEKDSLEADLGIEMIDTLKTRLESYFKRVLRD